MVFDLTQMFNRKRVNSAGNSQPLRNRSESVSRTRRRGARAIAQSWIFYGFAMVISLGLLSLGLSASTKSNLKRRLRPYAVSAIDHAFSSGKIDGPTVFGLHQSVETDFVGEAIPTICAGKLFYSNQESEESRMSDVPEISSAKVIKATLVQGPEVRWPSVCCEQCAHSLQCNAYKTDGNECSLLQIGQGLAGQETPRVNMVDDTQADVNDQIPERIVIPQNLQDADTSAKSDADSSANLGADSIVDDPYNVPEDSEAMPSQDNDELPESNSDANEANDGDASGMESSITDDEDDDNSNEIEMENSDNDDTVQVEEDEPDQVKPKTKVGNSDKHDGGIGDWDALANGIDLGDLGSLDSSLDGNEGANPLNSLFNNANLNSANEFMKDNPDLFSPSSDSVLDDLDDEFDADEETAELVEIPATKVEIESLVSVGVDSLLPMGDYVRQLGPFYGNMRKFFGRFRPLTSIYGAIADTVQHYKQHPLSKEWGVQAVAIGKSSEGNTIRSIEFGNHRRGRHVFVVAGLRGCDWTGPLAALHVAITLLGRSRTTLPILEHTRFHIIPIANPDGYVFSRRKSPSNARHWCKNRRVLFNSHGVALENNWGVQGISWGFGKEGKEGVRRDDFQGPEPFSEPETKALRDMIKYYATGRGRVAAIQIRCCSGSVEAPQMYKPQGGGANVDNVARALARVMKAPEGTDYSFETRQAPFSATNNGQMIDYLSGEMMVDHAYAVELKASGIATHKDRYQINPENFDPVVKELEYGVIFVAQQLLNMQLEGEPTPEIYNPRSSAASSDEDVGSTTTKRRGKQKAL